MKKLLKAVLIFLSAVLSVLSVSCKEKVLPPQVHMCMDTVCSVNLYDDGTEKLYKEIFLRFDDLEKQFSVTIPESNVSQLNSGAGTGPVQVSEDVYDMLEISSVVSKISGGAFDITTDPVIQLWGINTERARVPEQNEIDEALEKVGYERMFFADDGVRWAILENGMSINFGAVAKGYAADAVVEILKAHEVKKAILDLGGNIFCYGKKEDGKLWTVGIKNPENPTGAPLLKITSDEVSVVTSGIYERFLEKDGKKYHHIFDPKTGYPVENDLASVTVVCSVSTAADALSTACFVLGKQAALNCLSEFEKIFRTEIGLVFITKNGIVSATENLKGKISFVGENAGKEIDFVSAVGKPFGGSF
ncbi:MAG: FAD:protein FMN transferase [Treponema sp.]|nr:FAD:protein FMN transferase [Treponema sp.]